MSKGSNKKINNYMENDIEQFEKEKNLNQISSVLNKLYHSLKPSCPNNYTLPSNFQSLLQRILSSNFSVMKNDESMIINSLLDKVYKLSKYNKEAISRFQYLYSKLTKKSDLTKRWAILYILNSLSNDNMKNMTFSATNKLQQNYLNDDYKISNKVYIDNLLSNDSNLNIQENYINDNTSENNFLINNDNREYNNKCSNKCKKYLNNLSPKSNINEKFCDNENLIIHNDKKDSRNKHESYYSPIIIDNKKTSLTITEKDIIDDLLFVFEGINGKYIAYDASEDSFILSKLIPWSEEIYDIINSLSQLGWLYKKIKSYLDFYKNSNIKSQFIQSFVYSIQNELDEYYKLISFFRKMNMNNRTGKETVKKTLNLKNLILWTIDYKEKLKWILFCCESIHPLKGVAVLSQIYSFVNYGGSNAYLNNILNEVSKPFINFIVNWIKYGELQDPYKEFFVDILDGVIEDDLWNLKYQIVGKNVPNFMKRGPTLKIFEVGKCIHFIRNYCKERYNLSNLLNILKYLIEKNSKKNKINNGIDEEVEKNIDINNNFLEKINFDYGFEDDKIIYEIESLNSCYEFINYIFNISNQRDILNISLINSIINNIDIIHKLVNKDLVRIFTDKFKLISNLESINKYLLLGQGDMMQTLIESLYEELGKPANLILKHNLQSNLESAIRASNALLKDSENIKKLSIKLIKPSPGDSGWDIFCLEYKVDLPLNIIFNSKLLRDYQKLFIFFWKIKHIKFSQINHILMRLKNVNINSDLNENNIFIEKAIRISIHFNQEIVHFITNLHNYFALEVLETQYKKLKNELCKINNLDELINKHRQFVNNIKSQCLLDEESININKKIFAIFNIILKFSSSFGLFSSILDEIKYDINMDNNSVYMNNNINKNINLYLKQIEILYKDFHNQIIEFINKIDIIGKNNLKYLSMKLDYNYFYSFMEKEKEDKQNLLVIKRINDEKERKRILINDDDDNLYNNNDDNTQDLYNNEDNIQNENNNLINNNINFNNYNANNNEENYNKINNSHKGIDDEKIGSEEKKFEIDEPNNLKNKDYQNIINYEDFYNRPNLNIENNSYLDNENNEENKMININNINITKPKIEKIPYKNILNNNNIRNNKSEYSNKSLNSKKYNNNNLENKVNDKNNFLIGSQTEPKTNDYENRNIPEKGLTFNYKNNGEIETNLAEIEEEDQIITSIRPKIYGISRTKRNYENNN